MVLLDKIISIINNITIIYLLIFSLASWHYTDYLLAKVKELENKLKSKED